MAPARWRPGALIFGALLMVCPPTPMARGDTGQTAKAAKAKPDAESDASLAHIAAAKARVAKVYGKSIALVIGIDQYQEMTPLTGAVRDAKAMAEVLRDQGFDVHLLLDGQATAAGIKRLVTSGAVKDVGATDRVFIYFAGHGVSVGEGNRAMGYLMPVEAHEDLAAAEGVDMEWLQRVFRMQYRAKHVMFVADACYSGLAISTRGGRARAETPSAVARLAEKPVRLAFTAGSAGQQAHEEGGHGLFTYKLLQALRGHADSGRRDGIVTSAELWSYVQSEVTNTAARKGYEQTPQFGREGEGAMLFANLTGQVGTDPIGLTATAGPVIDQAPILAWSALGVGLAVAGVGGWALYDGQSKWDAAASQFATWDRAGGTTDGPQGLKDREAAKEEVERLNEQGNERTSLGRILVGVGGALLATSVVFFVLDAGPGEPAAGLTAVRVAVDPSIGGATLGFEAAW